MAIMLLNDFLISLYADGRVRVPRPSPAPADDQPVADAIAQIDAAARNELPAGELSLVVPAAEWAARMLYRAAQYLVYREVEAETVTQGLQIPCPESPSASVCYSVDLTFRFLPDLLAMAQGVAEDDPLTLGLRALAHAWPLSSVGVRGLTGVNIEPFIHHPALRLLYVDRIIERQDASRLSDPAAAEAVRAAIGLYPELAPAIARCLEGDAKA